jgi:hypothetical protein
MSATTAAPPPTRTDRRPTAHRLSRRDDAITLVLSTWLMIGLFVDGWAHSNLSELETFFTPWHALFYSGFTACAAWLGYKVIRGQEAGRRGLAAVPAGYELGIVGLVVFAVGGAGDFTWHTIFGIEQDIEALFSPTHLLLMLGIALVITSPLRAAWSEPGGRETGSLRRFLTPLMSLTLLTALVSFFFMYFSAFTDYSPVTSAADWGGEEGPYPGDIWLQVYGIANGLVTNLILMAPVLYLLKRWHPPFGSITVLFTVVAVMINAIVAFSAMVLVIPAVLGGLAADLLIRRLWPSPERPRAYRMLAVGVPLVLWTAYYLTQDIVSGIAWAPEIWTGMIVYNALAGLVLAQLMLPNRTPAAAAA